MVSLGNAGSGARDVPPAQQDGVTIEGLIAAHHSSLYRYAFRLSGRVQDAEDLTQQTFLLAQRKLHQLRDASKALSWLYAVLRSCYLKSLRKKTEIAAAGLELDIDAIPDSIPVDEIDRELLQNTLNDLPEEFRVVLVMFYFEECSYKEIAESLEIKIGTVMSRLSRAKDRLRRELLSNSPEPATR